jgi:hypothetical protein
MTGEPMNNLNGHTLAEVVADTLNTSLDNEETKEFIRAMTRQHRTLQQNFTRLCSEWIKHLAGLSNTQYDARNEASVKYAKQVVAATGDVGFPTI